MDLQLVLFLMSISVAFMPINAERILSNRMIDLRSKRDPKSIDRNPIIIEGLKSDLLSAAHIKVINQLARRFKNMNGPSSKHTSKKRRTPSIEMPNKVVREIHLRDLNSKHSMVQFKGYTTVPQKGKVISRRHACHHNVKKLFRSDYLRELSHKYVKSNDYSDEEEINTEMPAEKINLENLLSRSNKENLVQNDNNRLSSGERKLDSGENEDQREYIFVNVPQIAFEYVDNRNKPKKRNVFKHYGLLKRSVIEEENHATTASSFKLPAAESGLINNLIFKNINV
ncbi:uncharacterized protein [Battus philenor]|uniref:uncharacterized protein n=1 Tax=Battus philenor TaxID=42288 RepID=UPI0035CF50E9